LCSKKKGLVFCTDDGLPMAPDRFQKVDFTNAVILAGIGRMRFYDPRDTFGSSKIELGERFLHFNR